jgi:hypothetical protein
VDGRGAGEGDERGLMLSGVGRTELGLGPMLTCLLLTEKQDSKLLDILRYGQWYDEVGDQIRGEERRGKGDNKKFSRG